jgi:Transposase, Mutator family
VTRGPLCVATNGEPREFYALLDDGQPVLLDLDLGPRESYDAWLSFLQDLVARGLREPLLIVMDGAPGLVKAVKRVWRSSTSATSSSAHPTIVHTTIARPTIVHVTIVGSTITARIKLGLSNI